jgi:hypothetical protein
MSLNKYSLGKEKENKLANLNSHVNELYKIIFLRDFTFSRVVESEQACKFKLNIMPTSSVIFFYLAALFFSEIEGNTRLLTNMYILLLHVFVWN